MRGYVIKLDHENGQGWIQGFCPPYNTFHFEQRDLLDTISEGDPVDFVNRRGKQVAHVRIADGDEKKRYRGVIGDRHKTYFFIETARHKIFAHRNSNPNFDSLQVGDEVTFRYANENGRVFAVDVRAEDNSENA